MTSDHVYAVHAGVGVPIDTVDLLEPNALVALEEVTNYRQRLFYAFDPLQPFDVTRIEVGSRRGQLDRARPHKDQLRADVGCAALEIVGHAAGETGEKHDQADAQGDTRHADERANRALANV